MLSFKPKKLDPIEIICLAEQMHAVSCSVTTALEGHEKYEDSDALVMFCRMLSKTSRLKKDCSVIDKKTVSESISNGLLECSERIEGMCRLSLFDITDRNISSVIKEIIDMALEFQMETKRLYY